jgi:hypothetical protein
MISCFLMGLAIGAVAAMFVFSRLIPEPAKTPDHVPSAVGVGNTSVENVDAEWTRQNLAQLASGRFFEIR